MRAAQRAINVIEPVCLRKPLDRFKLTERPACAFRHSAERALCHVNRETGFLLQ